MTSNGDFGSGLCKENTIFIIQGLNVFLTTCKKEYIEGVKRERERENVENANIRKQMFKCALFIFLYLTTCF